MTEQTCQKEKKKGFWKKLLDRIDDKMEEKSKAAPCCGSDNKQGSSCC